jgi:hypothetical protein
MWQRTKRLINAYLDDLIERVSGPDRDVRSITRGEIARLNEVEVQSRASAKLFEKEIAELELKINGLLERERLLRERADESGASTAAREAYSLINQRDLLKQQLAEANSAAARASALREQRKIQGEDLATETHLTAMRENLAGVQSPFSSKDPSAAIDEMRARLAQSGSSRVDARVAEADRELEEARARASVEETLARYKQGLVESSTAPVTPAKTAPPVESIGDKAGSAEEPNATGPDSSASNAKTLGRKDGPVRPID